MTSSYNLSTISITPSASLILSCNLLLSPKILAWRATAWARLAQPAACFARPHMPHPFGVAQMAILWDIVASPAASGACPTPSAGTAHLWQPRPARQWLHVCEWCCLAVTPKGGPEGGATQSHCESLAHPFGHGVSIPIDGGRTKLKRLTYF